MAYDKKGDNKAYKKLKEDITSGNIGNLYVFYGEEDYLKSYYLGRLKGHCSGLFDEFSNVVLDAEHVTEQSLTDAIDSIPMGSEKKLVVVRDYKLLQPTGSLKEHLYDILDNLPEYICLVFYFEALEFKADKRLNLYKLIEKKGSVVDFRRAPDADLIPWLKRRFYALNKSIDTAECEYMLFICGDAMTNLITEAEKIAAGARGTQIKKADIDSLGSRVLEADVFQLTDCILQGDYRKGLLILRDLIDMKHEPIAILGAITRQMQRLYGARLAMDKGKGESYVADMFGFRSSYPAKLLMGGARKMSLSRLRQAQHMCLNADLELKSSLGNPQRILELLLLSIAQEGKK